VLIANDTEQEEELKEMGLKDPKASIKRKGKYMHYGHQKLSNLSNATHSIRNMEKIIRKENLPEEA
jgi:hypothetical protein